MTETGAARWTTFADQARSGELYLDSEEAARLCLAACDQRLTDLRDMLSTAQRAQNVSGFGDFAMADALTGMFETQATGTDNSIDKIIRDHIEVVRNMGEIMRISITRITGRDVTNTVNFDTGTGSVG